MRKPQRYNMKQIDYKGVIMRDYEDRETMQADQNRDSQQSKVDDAFVAIDDRLENLNHSISVMEKRLAPVANDYPRPTTDENVNTMAEKPTGDSSLLMKLYRLSSDIRMQEERIRSLMGRLDI